MYLKLAGVNFGSFYTTGIVSFFRHKFSYIWLTFKYKSEQTLKTKNGIYKSYVVITH